MTNLANLSPSAARRYLDQRDELLGWVTKARARHHPAPSPTGPPHCASCVHEIHPCPTARDLGVTK